MSRTLRRLGLFILAAALISVLAACPDGGSDAGSAAGDTLTRRQKDSIVGESGLPGSGGVKAMIEASDRQKARADRLDSLSGGR